MARHVLHIGLHKTGSSFLQAKVFPFIGGVTYLGRHFCQLNEAMNKMQYADETVYDPAELVEALEGIEGETILLSDESLSGKPYVFNSINRTMIARRLAAALPDATVLLFIRGQVDILTSHYAEYLIGGGTQKLSRFMWKAEPGITAADELAGRHPQRGAARHLYYNTNGPNMHLDNFLYTAVIESFADAFPRVEVMLYEDLWNRRERVHAKLQEVLGVTFDEAVGERFFDTTRVNRSIAGWRAPVLRTTNRCAELFDSKLVSAAIHRVGKGLRAIPGERSTDDWKRWIRDFAGDHYHADNRRVIERWPEIGLQDYPQKYPTGG